jgi:hypothetical protein
MPPKKMIEQLAKKLIARMFKKDMPIDDDETNQEVGNPSPEESKFKPVN